MDKIVIEGIAVDAVLGFLEEEKGAAQRLLISLSLTVDFSKIVASDDLVDGIDYVEVVACVREQVAEYRGLSLEKLADSLARFLKNRFTAEAVDLSVSKPRYCQALQLEAVRIDVQR